MKKNLVAKMVGLVLAAGITLTGCGNIAQAEQVSEIVEQKVQEPISYWEGVVVEKPTDDVVVVDAYGMYYVFQLDHGEEFEVSQEIFFAVDEDGVPVEFSLLPIENYIKL